MRKIYVLVLFSFISGISVSQNMTMSYRPSEGYVSSEKTAKIIAEAVLVPIYGIDEINKQKPFKVVLKGKNWIVEGSTPADRGIRYLGGHFTIHIARSTGEITHLSHSK
jgi:hypothetical protein